MASFNTNQGNELVNVEIGVEQDDGIFLYLVSQDEAAPFDLIVTSAYEIGQFFEEVERAKAEWERLKGAGDA